MCMENRQRLHELINRLAVRLSFYRTCRIGIHELAEKGLVRTAPSHGHASVILSNQGLCDLEALRDFRTQIFGLFGFRHGL